MRRIEGCVSGTTGEYEWVAYWTGREVCETGDKDTPDLYVPIVDKVEVIDCYIKSRGEEERRYTALIPTEVQKDAEEVAQDCADEGVYNYAD